MSDLFDQHVEFCEDCGDVSNDDSLSDDEKAKRMHECYLNALQDLAEMVEEQ